MAFWNRKAKLHEQVPPVAALPGTSYQEPEDMYAGKWARDSDTRLQDPDFQKSLKRWKQLSVDGAALASLPEADPRRAAYDREVKAVVQDAAKVLYRHGEPAWAEKLVPRTFHQRLGIFRSLAEDVQVEQVAALRARASSGQRQARVDIAAVRAEVNAASQEVLQARVQAILSVYVAAPSASAEQAERGVAWMVSNPDSLEGKTAIRDVETAREVSDAGVQKLDDAIAVSGQVYKELAAISGSGVDPLAVTAIDAARQASRSVDR